MNPKVSVIMTVRNGEPYIREAIESILGQTYSDFELLVIDNGSSDRSLQIVKNFSDSKIRIIELGRNIGRTPALNVGVKEAIGEYIAIHDADDISLPQRFEKQISYLEKNPDITLVGTHLYRIDTNNNCLKECFSIPNNWKIVNWHLLFKNCFPHSSILMHAQKIRDLGGYNENITYSQDYALYSDLMRRGEKMSRLSEILIHLRDHSQSVSATTSEDVVSRESGETSYQNLQYHLENYHRDSLKLFSQIVRYNKQTNSIIEAMLVIKVFKKLVKTFNKKYKLTRGEQSYLREDIDKRFLYFITQTGNQKNKLIPWFYLWGSLTISGIRSITKKHDTVRWLVKKTLKNSEIDKSIKTV